MLLSIFPPPSRLLHLRLVWRPYQGGVVRRGWPSKHQDEVEGREWPSKHQGEVEWRGWPSKHQGEVEGRGWPSKHQGNRNVWPPVNAREVVCAREAAAKGKRK